MRAVTAWAPLKISLSGEHAVGYGGSSVVAAVDAGLEIDATPAIADTGRLRSGEATEVWTPAEAVRFAARVDEAFAREGASAWRHWADDFFAPLRYAAGLAYAERPDAPPFDATSTEPGWADSGLGTSSASVACLSALCTALSGERSDPERLVATIRAADRLRHGGMPSGVDGAVVVHGGALRFADGQAEPLPPPPLGVLLVHTGVPRSCGEVIARFAQTPGRVLELYVQEMEEVGRQVVRALHAGDMPALVEAVAMDRQILDRYGLGFVRADELGALLTRRGALVTKLTGAGTGGALFALFDGPAPESVVLELAEAGVPARPCRFTDRGLDLRISPALAVQQLT